MKVKANGELAFKGKHLDSMRAKADITAKSLNLEELQDAADVFGSADKESNKGQLPDLNLNAHISLDTLLAGETTFLGISGNAFNTKMTDLNFDMSAQKLQYGAIVADSIS